MPSLWFGGMVQGSRQGPTISKISRRQRRSGSPVLFRAGSRLFGLMALMAVVLLGHPESPWRATWQRFWLQMVRPVLYLSTLLGGIGLQKRTATAQFMICIDSALTAKSPVSTAQAELHLVIRID